MLWLRGLQRRKLTLQGPDTNTPQQSIRAILQCSRMIMSACAHKFLLPQVTCDSQRWMGQQLLQGTCCPNLCPTNTTGK